MVSLLTLLALAGVPTCMSQVKVKVDLYYEAGCPFSYRYITGPLNKAFDTPGFMDMIDFEGHPFGNAYFVTQQCGGAGKYSMDARKCYERICGLSQSASAAPKPPDCFNHELVCQHGEAECKFNRAEACVKYMPGTTPDKEMEFFACIHPQAGAAANAHTEAQLVSTCATQTGINVKALQECWEAKTGSLDGAELIKKEAALTPVHPAVPWVAVNGKAIEDHDQILQEVCKTYMATPTALPGPAKQACSAPARMLNAETPLCLEADVCLPTAPQTAFVVRPLLWSCIANLH